MDNVIPTYQQLIGSLRTSELPFSAADLAAKISDAYDAIIILDDDPTGTQTVHDIPVLTEWSVKAIENEFDRGTPLFYILTNSRSLAEEDARNLGLEIARNIKQSAEAIGKKYLLISRSDSTLRGHYPLEIEVLTQVLQPKKGIHFLVPAFFEGGRYTIADVHYVREGEQMIPAGKTPFAQDKVFGYRSSNLRDWVVEKFDGKIDSTKIHSIALHELENTPSKELASKINAFQANDICIINAAHYDHLKLAIYAIFSADVAPFFRSAASLVATLAGQAPKFVDAQTMALEGKNGGLTVLGSYVPKSTDQLTHVLENAAIEPIEIDVSSLLAGSGPSSASIADRVDQFIGQGRDVIIFTSRRLISVEESGRNLEIGSIVSRYLTDIVSALTQTPRYIIGKGGITSSDLATRSLQIKRAIVLGQIISGVPVWKTLADSKFPGTPFIVFPGNVGDQTSLTHVIQKLHP